MREQVFDLNGYVIAQLWELLMQRLDDPQSVSRPVEEIWIAKGNMARARHHLLAKVSQHDLARHGTKAPVIYRDHRTMPAAVLTTPTGFDIAGNPRPAIGHPQKRVALERREVAAVRYQKSLPGHGDPRFQLLASLTRHAGFEPSGECLESRLELAAQYRPDTEFPQVRFVCRRIKTISDDMGAWIELLHSRDQPGGQSGRRMHRHIESRQVGFANKVFVPALHCQIQGRH